MIGTICGVEFLKAVHGFLEGRTLPHVSTKVISNTVILTFTGVCWKAAHSFLLQGKQQAVQKSVWWCGMGSGSTWVGQSHMQLTKKLLIQDRCSCSKQTCSERHLILQVCIEVVIGIKDIFYSSRIVFILFKRIEELANLINF